MFSNPTKNRKFLISYFHTPNIIYVERTGNSLTLTTTFHKTKIA